MPWVDAPSNWQQAREDIYESHGATAHAGDILAVYKQERSRGIMHTPEWQEKMAAIQECFDRANAEVTETFQRRLTERSS